MFFDACDGIFLNYFWKPEMVTRSAEVCGGRHGDVFVGIDVWGRGTYGGGKYDTHVALEVIAKHGLSTGVFAPAWTFESVGASDSGSMEAKMEMFACNEDQFWLGVRKKGTQSFCVS